MNWLNLFNNIHKAAALLPAAVQIATTIQSVMPPGTSGAVKMEVVKNSLQGVVDKEAAAENNFHEVWDHLSPMLTGLITLFKDRGVHGFSNDKLVTADAGLVPVITDENKNQ